MARITAIRISAISKTRVKSRAALRSGSLRAAALAGTVLASASPALAADKDKKWDPDELNIWLYKPQEFAKGTKMTFPGLPKVQDRADVIAYLKERAK